MRRIKANPVHADVRVILVFESTSELAKAVDETLRRTATLLGCDKYLLMPHFDTGRLMREIEASLPAYPPRKETMPDDAY
ncbi:MAG: hypothetical protein H0V89_13930 [Deltaproteobacteria bacterium]|nr:hypothetical protein [Deltaproteobacteria bacterium]